MAPGANATAAALPAAGCGPQPVMSTPAILGVMAVLVSAMQGTLVLESSAPCRISLQKLRVLLSLELVEVFIFIASETISFYQLRAALTPALSWLHWVPPCVLAIGLLMLVLDVWFTVWAASRSRIFWIPFSASSNADDRDSWVAETVALACNTGFSVYLIGWRQLWWMTAPFVSHEQAQRAFEGEGALGTAALGFSIGWALLVTLHRFVLAATFGGKMQGESVFEMARHMFRPNGFFKKPRNPVITEEESKEAIRCFRLTYDLRHGAGSSMHLKNETIVGVLHRAPLNVRNAIVGPHAKQIYETEHGKMGFVSSLLSLCEHITIQPLQICIFVALTQLYKRLDAVTLEVLKELVDVVIIVSLVDIALALKRILWGQRGAIHDEDIVPEVRWAVELQSDSYNMEYFK